MPSIQITAERTPTFTNIARLGDTVRGLAKETYVLDWWLETAVVSKAAVTLTPDGSPSPVL